MRQLPVLLAVLLLAGCSTLPAPNVSLVNVQFGAATAFETTAQFTLRVTNETPEPLVLNGGSFKIYLNGLFIGDGVSSDELSLSRLSTGTMTIAVHLSNLRLATRIKPLLESKSFDYKITGKLYATQPKGTISVSNDGRLDLNDFQPSQTSAR